MRSKFNCLTACNSLLYSVVAFRMGPKNNRNHSESSKSCSSRSCLSLQKLTSGTEEPSTRLRARAEL